MLFNVTHFAYFVSFSLLCAADGGELSSVMSTLLMRMEAMCCTLLGFRRSQVGPGGWCRWATTHRMYSGHKFKTFEVFSLVLHVLPPFFASYFGSFQRPSRLSMII